MMVHWSSYLYKYPSWIDILAYCTDRFTDVTLMLQVAVHQRKGTKSITPKMKEIMGILHSGLLTC
jgi:hypothetical protein